jgi:hypothetical protein
MASYMATVHPVKAQDPPVIWSHIADLIVIVVSP